jgi:hypothetical protein
MREEQGGGGVEGRDAPCGGNHGGERRRRGLREAEEGALPGRGGVRGVAGSRAQSAHARARPGSSRVDGARSIDAARDGRDRVRLLAGSLWGSNWLSLGCCYIGIWVGFSFPDLVVARTGC